MKYRAVLKFYDKSGSTRTVPVPDAPWRASRFHAVQDLMDYVRSGQETPVDSDWVQAGNDIQQRA